MPVQLLNQSAKSMHAATERLRAMVHAGLLFHNGDPVARWAASSCEYKYDADGFPKLIKSNLDAKVRIDPIAALSMAVDRLNAWEREIRGTGGRVQGFLHRLDLIRRGVVWRLRRAKGDLLQWGAGVIWLTAVVVAQVVDELHTWEGTLGVLPLAVHAWLAGYFTEDGEDDAGE